MVPYYKTTNKNKLTLFCEIICVVKMKMQIKSKMIKKTPL